MLVFLRARSAAITHHREMRTLSVRQKQRCGDEPGTLRHILYLGAQGRAV